MARVCEVTGKKAQFGNNVSHANNRTRRRWTVNLQEISLPSEALGRMVSLKMSVNALRSIEKNGGIDGYLLSRKSAELSAATRLLKKQVEAAQARKAS